MNRPTASLSPIMVVLAALGAACGDSKPKEAPAAAAASQAPAAASPEAACVEGKVPADQKDKLVEAFEANRTKWRAMSTTKEGAMALTVTCKAATEKAREALSVDYGCEF